MAVAAPARRAAPAKAPARKPSPARKSSPARKPSGPSARSGARAPLRKAPARAPRRAAPRHRRASGGQLIPIAVGRTAGAVRQLPDSGLVVRMTRGRAWIAVLGVLLVGIVALNVVTLSFAASAGHIEQNIQALQQENSILSGRDAALSATERVRNQAAAQGLAMPTADRIVAIQASTKDVAVAAQRLAAAGGG